MRIPHLLCKHAPLCVPLSFFSPLPLSHANFSPLALKPKHTDDKTMKQSSQPETRKPEIPHSGTLCSKCQASPSQAKQKKKHNQARRDQATETHMQSHTYRLESCSCILSSPGACRRKQNRTLITIKSSAPVPGTSSAVVDIDSLESCKCSSHP